MCGNWGGEGRGEDGARAEGEGTMVSMVLVMMVTMVLVMMLTTLVMMMLAGMVGTRFPNSIYKHSRSSASAAGMLIIIIIIII